MANQDPTMLPAIEQLVLRLLMAKGSEAYGRELMKESGGRLKSGTAYVTLMRMEDKGLLSSRTESPQPGKVGRPRRFYKITAHGSRSLAHSDMSLGAFTLEGIV